MCNTDDLPDGPDSPVTQSCLNKYPLDRAEDDDNQPIDPANRGRFFLDPPCRAGETNQDLLPGAYPGDVATARFKLPDGVTCERCIVQMVYCEFGVAYMLVSDASCLFLCLCSVLAILWLVLFVVPVRA